MSAILAENISVKLNGNSILHQLSFALPTGNSMAIVGASGSGKTTLGRLIAGSVQASSGDLSFSPDQTRLMVEQQDNFMAVSRLKTSYYGQRYEHLGLDEVPTIAEYLGSIHRAATPEIQQTEIQQSLETMQMLDAADRKLMLLSNGERKRIQLAVALLQNPDVLVLDQPFVGLDIATRKKLEELIVKLQHNGKTIILICDQEHIPASIGFVLKLENGRIAQFCKTENFEPEINGNESNSIAAHFVEDLQSSKQDEFEFAVKMNAVQVVYAEKVILKNIHWTVRKGERWALTGPNGAGKTTLLSLITADNPQGYVNDLVLFDRKRGSGESIWDIKKRIGYISPELHLYFMRGKGIFNSVPGLGNAPSFSGNSISCQDVISSGFHDLIGFSDRTSEMNQKTVQKWLSVLNLEKRAKSWFHEVSLGEQRLLLLARALVKMPSLLILDEPCQGLDSHQSKLFIDMLDSVCQHLETTLIYVTHYSEEIPKSVQYLLELESGQVNYCGDFKLQTQNI